MLLGRPVVVEANLDTGPEAPKPIRVPGERARAGARLGCRRKSVCGGPGV